MIDIETNGSKTKIEPNEKMARRIKDIERKILRDQCEFDYEDNNELGAIVWNWRIEQRGKRWRERQ